MFTGIIAHVGTIRSASSTPAGKRLAIDLGPVATGLALSDSVAVSGVCLTATAIDGAIASFDVVTETLTRTTLGDMRTGGRVNLECALRLGQGLDGHLVQGHVDGLARVRSIRRGGQWVIEFAAERDLTDLMVPKGSVAIDGVSLTLVDVNKTGFSVALIPTTLDQATLCDLQTGDVVNIETDIIGKYVRKYLTGMSPASSGKLTLDKLKELGFA